MDVILHSDFDNAKQEVIIKLVNFFGRHFW